MRFLQLEKACCYIVLFLLASSCAFSPEEVYFKEVKEVKPTFSIALNGFNENDTIYIYKNTLFDYDIGLSNSQFELVSILFDNKVVTTLYRAKGQFDLSYPTLKSGVFELKIQFQSTSATGSLAANAGLEKFVTWKKWILKVDINPPSKPVIQFSNPSGFLTVTWGAYTKPNFIQYRLTRSEGNSVRSFLIKNSKTNYWIDSGFVAGVVKYDLSLETSLSPTGVFQSDQASAVHDLKTKFVFSPEDSIAKITIVPTPFYGAFKEYEVSGIYVNSVNYKSTKYNESSFSVKMTSVRFNVDDLLVYFRANSRFGYDVGYYNRYQFLLQLGRNLDANAGGMFYNQTYDKYLYITDTKSAGTEFYQELYVYNSDFSINSINKLGKLFGGVRYYPFLGKYLYSQGTTEIGIYDWIEKKYLGKQYNSDVSYQISTGSTNGLYGTYSSYKTGGIWVYSAVVYNLLKNTALFSKSSLDPVNCKISDDGMFLLSNENVYQVNGDVVVPIGKLSSSVGANFRKDNSSEIIVVKSATVEVFNTSTANLARVFTNPFINGGYLYDPQTHYLFFYDWSTGNAGVLNVDTGKSKAFKFGGSRTDFYFVNGYLFNAKGTFIKVI